MTNKIQTVANQIIKAINGKEPVVFIKNTELNLGRNGDFCDLALEVDDTGDNLFLTTPHHQLDLEDTLKKFKKSKNKTLLVNFGWLREDAPSFCEFLEAIKAEFAIKNKLIVFVG